MKNSNQYSERFILPLVGLLLLSLKMSAQVAPNVRPPGKWAAEVNILWPFAPGDGYNGKVLYQVYRNEKTSGQVFVGVNYQAEAFRENEGNFSATEVTFGYRQFFWKGLHAEFYNAFGPGRIRNSVVDGRDYTSTDYVVGGFVGYKFGFGKKTVRPYLNLQPLGVLYVAYQSNPHPIVGQTSERPFYAGTVQFGIDF